jgi:hypothetical protein
MISISSSVLILLTLVCVHSHAEKETVDSVSFHLLFCIEFMHVWVRKY